MLPLAQLTSLQGVLARSANRTLSPYMLQPGKAFAGVIFRGGPSLSRKPLWSMPIRSLSLPVKPSAPQQQLRKLSRLAGMVSARPVLTSSPAAPSVLVTPTRRALESICIQSRSARSSRNAGRRLTKSIPSERVRSVVNNFFPVGADPFRVRLRRVAWFAVKSILAVPLCFLAGAAIDALQEPNVFIRQTQRQTHLLGALGCMAIVLALWNVRVGGVQRFLWQHFTHNPSSGKFYTTFTSAVSHSGVVHFAFNAIAFYTIAQSVYHFFTPGEFFSICSSAAVGSGFLTSLHYLARGSAKPGLGLSGVVLALLSMSALLNPDARYQIIFFPFFDFSGLEAVAGIALLDVIGLVRGWSMFGHAAHLGGLLSGFILISETKPLARKARRFLRDLRHELNK